MLYNEADTRANLIDPKLNMAGWTRSQVTREHFCWRDQRCTAGRIACIGNEARRRETRQVEYLLRYTDAFPHHSQVLTTFPTPDELWARWPLAACRAAIIAAWRKTTFSGRWPGGAGDGGSPEPRVHVAGGGSRMGTGSRDTC